MQDRLETVLRDAQQIAGSPEEHLDSPHLFTTAWATLKAARGQGFDPARLRAAHLVERPAPTPEPTEQVLERVGHKVRRVMADRQITPHGPPCGVRRGAPAMTNPISHASAPMADASRGPRPSEINEHARRVGGLRGVANTEVSHSSRGADLARADQSSKLPTARASSAEINTLALYAVTEALRATPMHQRSEQFTDLGGCMGL